MMIQQQVIFLRPFAVEGLGDVRVDRIHQLRVFVEDIVDSFVFGVIRLRDFQSGQGLKIELRLVIEFGSHGASTCASYEGNFL